MKVSKWLMILFSEQPGMESPAVSPRPTSRDRSASPPGGVGVAPAVSPRSEPPQRTTQSPTSPNGREAVIKTEIEGWHFHLCCIVQVLRFRYPIGGA